MIFPLLILTVYHLLEWWLEVAVIELKNPFHKDYDWRDKQEHFRSAVLAAFVLGCICYWNVEHYDAWWMLPALIVNRRIFFDYALYISEDWTYYKYVGSGWWDNLFAKIFGVNGRLIELAVTLVITFLSLSKTYLWL